VTDLLSIFTREKMTKKKISKHRAHDLQFEVSDRCSQVNEKNV